MKMRGTYINGEGPFLGKTWRLKTHWYKGMNIDSNGDRQI